MNCDRCNTAIEDGQQMTYVRQTLCEDCYMDALSPVRACDPWAVHSAKSMPAGSSGLTARQKQILTILKESNGLDQDRLARKSGLSMNVLQREIATLRHMEKLRAVKVGDSKVFRVW